MDEPRTDFQCTMEIAERIALIEGRVIDDETRSAARNMLRSQFALWANYDGGDDTASPADESGNRG